MGTGIALILTITVGLSQEKTGLAESLVGRYEHMPPQNDWHEVTIEFGTEGNLLWKNARVQVTSGTRVASEAGKTGVIRFLASWRGAARLRAGFQKAVRGHGDCHERSEGKAQP